MKHYNCNITSCHDCPKIWDAADLYAGRKADAATPTALVAVVYPNYDKFEKDRSDENVQSTILASIRAINRTLPSFKQIQLIELRKTEFEKTTSKKIKRHLLW